MKVNKLYTFEVWDTLEKGRCVRMIDYANAKIINLIALTVSEVVDLIKKSKDNEKMYMFYELVEEDTNNE